MREMQNLGGIRRPCWILMWWRSRGEGSEGNPHIMRRVSFFALDLRSGDAKAKKETLREMDTAEVGGGHPATGRVATSQPVAGMATVFMFM
jgi:hypothetical protein